MTLHVVPGSAGAQSARPAGSPGQTKESMAFGKQLRVLIVDDEPSICKALTMALTRAGYEAVAALSGEAALAIIRSEHVDIMLVDFRIPDMRGDVIFELAAGFQPHLRYQTLFMTGDITDRAHQLIAACKCHFLRKPFDLRDMWDSIAALAPRLHDAAG
jgi:Response regulator containing CheY-like receiver, AAA-type ATPase, and DNA-binding domains